MTLQRLERARRPTVNPPCNASSIHTPASAQSSPDANPVEQTYNRTNTSPKSPKSKMAEPPKKEESFRESVTVQRFGSIEGGFPLPSDWPRGKILMEMMSNKGIDASKIGDEAYWQASARLALMRKYEHLPDAFKVAYTHTDTGGRQLALTYNDIATIQTTWEKLVQETSNDDLAEFLHTSFSSGRQLHWAVMDCAPGTHFNMHAHPNIEVVYCIRGALHEIRMSGEPIERNFKSGQVYGPNLTQLDRSWYFGTLAQGEWLVNEVGSIHKSFTATNGNGCLLMCLWGGGHADIQQGDEPERVNVQQALGRMDEKLSTCDCTKWDQILETFLPASERRSS
jgi:hypothetical protein